MAGAERAKPEGARRAAFKPPGEIEHDSQQPRDVRRTHNVTALTFADVRS